MCYLGNALPSLLGSPSLNLDLLAWLAACNKDPMAFVMGAFPWGEPDTALEQFTGPEAWQVRILQDLKDGLLTPNSAIQLARASGHGIGKSACVSWIILWAFSTAPDTRGVVTANTETQLKTKTWAELGKWFNMFIAKDHFTLTATALLSKDPSRERTWRSKLLNHLYSDFHSYGKSLPRKPNMRICLSSIPSCSEKLVQNSIIDSQPTDNLALFCTPQKWLCYWH